MNRAVTTLLSIAVLLLISYYIVESTQPAATKKHRIRNGGTKPTIGDASPVGADQEDIVDATKNPTAAASTATPKGDADTERESLQQATAPPPAATLTTPTDDDGIKSTVGSKSGPHAVFLSTSGDACPVDAAQRSGKAQLGELLSPQPARVQELHLVASHFMTETEMQHHLAGTVDAAIKEQPLYRRFNAVYKACMTHCLFAEVGCDAVEVEDPAEKDPVDAAFKCRFFRFGGDRETQERELVEKRKQEDQQVGRFSIFLRSSFIVATQDGQHKFVDPCFATVFQHMLRRQDEAPQGPDEKYLSRLSEEAIKNMLSKPPFAEATGPTKSVVADFKNNLQLLDSWFEPYNNAMQLELVAEYFANFPITGPHARRECFTACVLSRICVTVTMAGQSCRLSNRLPKEGPRNGRKSDTYVISLNKATVPNPPEPTMEAATAGFEAPQRVPAALFAKDRQVGFDSFLDLQAGAMPWSLTLTTKTSMFLRAHSPSALPAPIKLETPQDCMLQCARYTRCLSALFYPGGPCVLLGLPMPPMDSRFSTVKGRPSGNGEEAFVHILRLRRGGVRTEGLTKVPDGGVGNRHMFGVLAALDYATDRAAVQAKTFLHKDDAEDIAYSLEPSGGFSRNQTMAEFRDRMMKANIPQRDVSGYVHNVPRPYRDTNQRGAWKGTRVLETMLAKMAQTRTTIDDYDWFVAMDDDTFVMMENANWLLDTLSNPLKSSTPIVTGMLAHSFDESFISGSSGIYINRAAMKLLVRALRWTINHEALLSFGDMRFGQFVRVASGFSAQKARPPVNIPLHEMGLGGRNPGHHFGLGGAFAGDISYERPNEIRLVDTDFGCFMVPKMHATDQVFLHPRRPNGQGHSCQFPFAFHQYRNPDQFAETEKLLVKARKVRDASRRSTAAEKEFVAPLRSVDMAP